MPIGPLKYSCWPPPATIATVSWTGMGRFPPSLSLTHPCSWPDCTLLSWLCNMASPNASLFHCPDFPKCHVLRQNSFVVQLEHRLFCLAVSQSATSNSSGVVLYRTIEYPELERIHKGHQIQLLALHMTAPKITPCARDRVCV